VTHVPPQSDIREAAKDLFERRFLPGAEREQAIERIDRTLDHKITKVSGRDLRYHDQLVELLAQAKSLWARRGELDRKQLTMLAGALLYFISPLDVVADLVPGLGYVDDFFVLAYVLKTLAGSLVPLRDALVEQAAGSVAEKGRKVLEDVIDSRLIELDRVSTHALRRSIGVVAIGLWGATTTAAISLAVATATGAYALEWTVYVAVTAALIAAWNVATAVSCWRAFRKLDGDARQRLVALVAARTRKRDIAAIVVPVLLLIALVAARFALLA
jgi:uncharacterized membrane protein YkvA (DUF1232 family)